MRIRASVLTPILAMLTVVAIVGMGIALGQSRGGDASATLLGSTPSFAAAAETDATIVADAGLPQTGGGSLEQPVAETPPVVQPVEPEPVAPASVVVAVRQRPAAPPATSPPTTHPVPPTDSAETEDGEDEPALDEVDHPSEPAESDHGEDAESDPDQMEDSAGMEDD